jgi:hypothetical protein
MNALDPIIRGVAASASGTLSAHLVFGTVVFGTATAAAFRLLPHGHENGQTRS